jgi:hypothetical protein
MEELLTQLTQLKLGRIGEVYRDWIDRASKEEMGYADFLRGLLSEEVCATGNSIVRKELAKSRLPSS